METIARSRFGKTAASGTPPDPKSASRGGVTVAHAAVLSAAVGTIHLFVAGSHFDYYWTHGAFFVAVGLGQIAWAALVLAFPSRFLLMAGIAGNALIVGTWIMSRTLGAPFGPRAWTPEPIAYIDLLATGFEVLIVVWTFFLLRPGPAVAPDSSSLRSFFGFAGVVLTLSTAAIVVDGLRGHAHGGAVEAGLVAEGAHLHSGSPIAPDDPLLLELKEVVRERGPIAAMDLLEQRVAKDDRVRSLSHQYVHSLARSHYNISPNAATAFTRCDERFEGGCYHGVLQGYFEDNPGFTGAKVAGLCRELGATTDIDLKWQCLHGLGHGLTLFFDHNLLRPLRYCDFLSADWDRRSCYGGVFMENVIWGQNRRAAGASVGEGVITEDLEYPCNAIDDKYKTDCWLMQTSTILPMVNWDFDRAFAACDDAEKAYVSLCYESMGRDLAGYTLHRPVATGQLCLRGDARFQGHCFSGAAKQLVDFHGRTDGAVRMCAAGPKSAKPQCYQALGEIAYFYWSDDEQRRRAECGKARVPKWIAVCEQAAQPAQR
ncbi:MAG: hypothetical protein M3N24_07335 [Actinomycetota bacterium]|nr:hypothetical protein [Actinomycetota bacterium]